MIVTCDKCKAKYKVDDKLAGKKVRCANCGNVWRFELDAFTVTDFEDENAQTDTESNPSSVSSTNDADNPPLNQTAADAMFDAPPAPVDDAPKSQAAADAMFDTPPAPADDASKSQADVDAMFDSFVKQAETEQLQAEAGATETTGEGETAGEGEAPAAPENGGDAEIPPSIVDEITAVKNNDPAYGESAKNDNQKPAFGMSLVKFVAVTIATVVVCLTASLWFLRFQLTQEFPELTGIYEIFGIDVLPAGTGLEFKEIVYEKTVEEDTEYLWIKGKIVNISDKQRKIPSVMLVLYDGNRKMLDATVYSELNGKKLPPGKDEPFTIWTTNPSKSTAEAEITFTREKSKK